MDQYHVEMIPSTELLTAKKGLLIYCYPILLFESPCQGPAFPKSEEIAPYLPQKVNM